MQDKIELRTFTNNNQAKILALSASVEIHSGATLLSVTQPYLGCT
jgi:hypothetical protein